MPSDKKKLYEAIEALQPRSFADVPLGNLSNFLSETFSSAELIANSVPPPPATKAASEVNSLKTPATKLAASEATSVASSQVSLPSIKSTHEELREHWGKPLKVGAKDNPLNLSIYKLPPHDKHGAWFARRSIHEGLSFDKWKRAMKSEFAESIKVKGGPGAGAVRGIGAERLVERQAVKGVGKMEVYQLSAQFPGPTAPRDFVTMLLTTEEGLSDSSRPYSEEGSANEDMPRHYMVVSVPVDHTDTPVRSGLVRGHYESIELIREIPQASSSQQSTANITSKLTDALSSSKAASDKESPSEIVSEAASVKSAKSKSEEQGEGPTMNPVEWIMVTRSDPGGGIPKFMVERATPSSIAGDAVKFVNWVTSHDFPEEVVDEIPIETNADEDAAETLNLPPLSRKITDGSTFEPSRANDTGVIASLTSAVRLGFDSYAPEVLRTGLSSILVTQPDGSNGKAREDDSDSDDATDVSSIESFASAEQFTTAPEKGGHLDVPSQDPLISSANTSTDQVSLDSNATGSKSSSSLEKRLAKIEEQRAKIESELSKGLARDEKKAREQQSREEKDIQKATERLEKQKKRREEKYAKEMQKLEKKREAEQRKAEKKREKNEEGDALSKMKRERDQSRRMAEVLRKESEVLRERLGEVQRENTELVRRLSMLKGGKEVLEEVKAEGGSE